jgi:hypothetical protein
LVSHASIQVCLCKDLLNPVNNAVSLVSWH